jgi:hypothetical protein
MNKALQIPSGQQLTVAPGVYSTQLTDISDMINAIMPLMMLMMFMGMMMPMMRGMTSAITTTK